MTDTAHGVASGGRSGRAAAAPTLHHVFLKTGRFEEMKAFYAAVLGMRPNFDSPMVAFLSNDEANHRLALLNHDQLQDSTVDHAGLHHHAYQHASIDDLLDTYVRLRAIGILPAMMLDHGPSISTYYRDPDGNLVELLVANFEHDPEDTIAFLAGEQFLANPLGVFVDPELLLAAREAGSSPRELHRRAYDEREFTPPNPPAFAGMPSTMRL